jgi:hypothetical protein
LIRETRDKMKKEETNESVILGNAWFCS